MNDMPTLGITVIAQLRVLGSSSDPLLARLRLSSMLGAASMRPTGLPSASILCLRALPDPLPGTLSLDVPSIAPPSVWEQALHVSLNRAAEQAVRPVLGAVPPDAGAVLFADYAEMLACLALDWSAGEIHTHWWWQHLSAGIGRARGVPQMWLESPQFVPAALDLLARRGAAVTFARHLIPSESRSLAQESARCFAAPDLLHVLATHSSTPVAGSPAESPAAAPYDSGSIREHDAEPLPPSHQRRWAHTASPITTPPPVPWQAVVPEAAAPTLTVDQRVLLGVALMLRRAPQRARDSRFASAVAEWLAAAASAEAGLPAQSSAPASPLQFASLPPAASRTRPISTPRLTAKLIAPTRLPAQEDMPDASPRFEERDSDPALPSGPLHSLTAEPEAEVETAAYKPQAQDQIQLVEAQPPLIEAEINTRAGGLLYLINVFLALGLYPDFTEPETAGIGLPLWDLLELIGKRWFRRADPLWALLTSLAGRAEDEAAGTGFDAPREWRIPPSWLAAYPERRMWRWQQQEGRLHIWHPAGFWIVDVAATRSVDRQLAREIAPYRELGHFKLRAGNVRAPRHHDPLVRWLDWLEAYLRSRLKRAMGMGNGSQTIALICQRPALIRLTPGHLEVVFSLDDLPIEIRLAGLDRNPGWVPAAGRVITYVFE